MDKFWSLSWSGWKTFQPSHPPTPSQGGAGMYHVSIGILVLFLVPKLLSWPGGQEGDNNPTYLEHICSNHRLCWSLLKDWHPALKKVKYYFQLGAIRKCQLHIYSLNFSNSLWSGCFASQKRERPNFSEFMRLSILHGTWCPHILVDGCYIIEDNSMLLVAVHTFLQNYIHVDVVEHLPTNFMPGHILKKEDISLSRPEVQVEYGWWTANHPVIPYDTLFYPPVIDS